MPDLLTHVLVAYALATLWAWRDESITPRLVTVAMLGAIVPDFNRMELLVPAATIESALGVPFAWSFHKLPTSALVVLIAALLVSPQYRRRVLSLLALGTGSHLVLDLFLYKPTGLSYVALWPLTDHRFAIDGFYLSSDRWPALLSAIFAVGVRFVARHRVTDPSSANATRRPTESIDPSRDRLP